MDGEYGNNALNIKKFRKQKLKIFYQMVHGKYSTFTADIAFCAKWN